MKMDTKIRRLAAAGAVAGFLTVFGVSLASAQEDPTTTTTDGTADREDSPKDGSAPDAPTAETGS
jgi:hypothetical protein